MVRSMTSTRALLPRTGLFQVALLLFFVSVVAAVLIGLGVLLWAVNRAVVGRVDEFDPSRLGK